MKKMTVRDIRLRWPEAEKALAVEGEIVVTRDSKPVARILPYVSPAEKRRERFDQKEHLRWLRKISKGERTIPSTDDLLREDRDESTS